MPNTVQCLKLITQNSNTVLNERFQMMMDKDTVQELLKYDNKKMQHEGEETDTTR